MLDKMRISLNLDDNVTVDPAVLYMNLNEDNYITVTDQLKQKKVYKVRGRIVKSKSLSAGGTVASVAGFERHH